MNKQAILALVVQQLQTNITLASQAVTIAKDTATHQDCLGSSKYETMGIEASYLAKGQGERLLGLQCALAHFQQVIVAPSATIGLSSWLILEDEQGTQQNLWLAADAGGLKVTHGQAFTTVITIKSPLGRALLGKEEGDEVTLKIAGKEQCYQVIHIY